MNTTTVKFLVFKTGQAETLKGEKRGDKSMNNSNIFVTEKRLAISCLLCETSKHADNLRDVDMKFANW